MDDNIVIPHHDRSALAPAREPKKW
jgi:hypothetical protein